MSDVLGSGKKDRPHSAPDLQRDWIQPNNPDYLSTQILVTSNTPQRRVFLQ